MPSFHGCPCGGLAAGASAEEARLHHHWSCPVAAAVLGSIEAAIARVRGATGDDAILPREALWLMEPPPRRQRVHPGVWQVVCLAAASAMDHGRRRLVAMHLERHRPPRDRNQRTLWEVWQPQTGRQQLQQASPALLERVKKGAVARFWQGLADFAEVGKVPSDWTSAAVGEGPFFSLNFQRQLAVVVPHGVVFEREGAEV